MCDMWNSLTLSPHACVTCGSPLAPFIWSIYDSYDNEEKEKKKLFLLLSNKGTRGYISKITFERNYKECLYLLSLSVIIQ